MTPAPMWKPSHSPWLVTFSVLLATFIEILDTSIANVALPHIAGSLSSSIEESTWVLTSYLIANAIILPASAWLSGRFGRKRYLTFSVLIFTLASALCGMAQNLPELIGARLIQGLGGGGLQPIVQAILLESFAPEDRGMAMAAYGMGVVVAPIIGPTLGGWITDNFSWRWIFFINLPIGLLAIFMQNLFVEDPPYLIRKTGHSIDGVGFALMALWIGTLQVILDKGQEADWLGAVWIRWSLTMAIVCFIIFVIWEWHQDEPIVSLGVLKDRNFAIATFLTTIIFSVIYGTTVLLPLFMQNLLGYTAFQSGWSMGPRGIGSFLAMLAIGRLMKIVDNRFLIAIGLTAVGVTCWILGGLTLDITPSNITWPLVLNGLGAAFIFVPMTTLSVATLRQDEIQNSTGIYSLMRNLGSSVGISIVTTMQTRLAQVHQAILATHLTANNPAYQGMLKKAESLLMTIPPDEARHIAVGVAYRELLQQAALISFIDIFRDLAAVCLACVPLVFLFRRGRRKAGPAVDVH